MCCFFVLKNLIPCLCNCLGKASQYDCLGGCGWLLFSPPWLSALSMFLQGACTHVASRCKEQKTWTLSGLPRNSRLQVGCTLRALTVGRTESLVTEGPWHRGSGPVAKDILCSAGSPCGRAWLWQSGNRSPCITMGPSFWCFSLCFVFPKSPGRTPYWVTCSLGESCSRLFLSNHGTET